MAIVTGAGIRNESVTWVTQFKADNLSKADLDRFPPTHRGVSDEVQRCAAVQPMRACSGGFQATNAQISCGLKHMYIVEQIAARKTDIEGHFTFSVSLCMFTITILPMDLLTCTMRSSVSLCSKTTRSFRDISCSRLSR